MTVNELIAALKRCPTDAIVYITSNGEQNEWPATVVTLEKHGAGHVRLIDTNAEVSVGERVLHDDNLEPEELPA